MRRYKTYKKKHSLKRKTARRGYKRLSIRRKKGGVNNNNNNNNDEFDERRANLINTLQDIIDRADVASMNGTADEMVFIDEIRAFEPEADLIDAHYGNHDMEDMLNQRMNDVMMFFGLVGINNNNNNTATIVSNINMNMNSNMNNNTNSVISMYNAKNGKKLKKK